MFLAQARLVVRAIEPGRVLRREEVRSLELVGVGRHEREVPRSADHPVVNAEPVGDAALDELSVDGRRVEVLFARADEDGNGHVRQRALWQKPTGSRRRAARARDPRVTLHRQGSKRPVARLVRAARGPTPCEGERRVSPERVPDDSDGGTQVRPDESVRVGRVDHEAQVPGPVLQVRDGEREGVVPRLLPG